MSNPSHRYNQPSRTIISKATSKDAPAIQAMVDAAYSKYIERIGKRPVPMDVDYLHLISTGSVYILQQQETSSEGSDSTYIPPTTTKTAVGSITLRLDSSHNSIQINNFAVVPEAQGRGYGRLLMRFAEDKAREAGCLAVTLFTNTAMYESVALYVEWGFVEVGRRSKASHFIVDFLKELPVGGAMKFDVEGNEVVRTIIS